MINYTAEAVGTAMLILFGAGVAFRSREEHVGDDTASEHDEHRGSDRFRGEFDHDG